MANFLQTISRRKAWVLLATGTGAVAVVACLLGPWSKRGREVAAGSELVRLRAWRIAPPKDPETATPPRGQTRLKTPAPTAGGGPRLDAGLRRQWTLIDPTAAGWQSEWRSQQMAQQLETLRQALASGDTALPAACAKVFAPGCLSSALLPGALEPVVREGPLQVFRGDAPERATLGGIALARAELARWGLGLNPGRLSFKVTGIRRAGENFETTVLVSSSGDGGGLLRGEVAQWQITWAPVAGEPEAPPRISEIAVLRYQVAELSRGGDPLFVDRTAAAMAAVPAYPRQYLQGHNHWSRAIPVAEGGALFSYNGIALGDADGDGLDDLYVPAGGNLPNRLLRHRPDGTLQDISATAGVDWLEQTVSALFVDLDNDGDQDLVAAVAPFLLFMENDGRGTFVQRGAHRSAPNPFSLVAADFDGDALLDLYLCNYSGAGDAGNSGSGTIASYPLPYSDANNGLPNVLLKNLGGFGFRDVTAETGLDQGNRRFSQAAAWADYDGDGDPDLYVANDFGRNNLYRNDSGGGPVGRVFTDVAAELGVEDQASGMSAAWGDIDRDGRLDLYISNMFSAAGSRVTYQPQFSLGRTGDKVAEARRMARGNTLYRARGDGGFDDIGEAAGVAMARWAWGAPFLDLDNDGWEDLVVANGFLTNDRPDDL